MIVSEGCGGVCQNVRSRRRTGFEGISRGVLRLRKGGEVEEWEGETLRETTAFLVNISSAFAKAQR